MRNFYIFCLYVFSIFFISSCKKEYPVTSSETPVFYISGTINGNAVNIQAGINDYYMYSSFTHDSNAVFNFLGELKPTNCIWGACTNWMQIKINDYKVSPSPNSPSIIDSSLEVGYYPLQIPGGASNQYSVHFTAVPNSNVLNYSWNFGDNTSSVLANPVHIYSNPGAYNVCLTMTYTNGCVSSLCNTVKVGKISGIDRANITGNTMIYPGDSTSLDVLLNSCSSASSYYWSGNGLSAVTLSSVNVTPTATTTYTVIACCATACDTAEVTVLVVPQSQQCISNFNFSVDSAAVFSNPYSFSNVTLTWTDHLGAVYTSNNSAQTTDSYFQIVSVEDYSNNELGQRTKKVHVKFKCKMFDNVGGATPVQIDNGDAVIAVAYK